MSTNPTPALAPTKLIHLNLIDESPTNPRKDFGDLTELAASIREKGVLQNIVVRPVADRFEIVFGHRRYRAAREAGLTEIPAAIRSLDDVQVLEEQLVENAQRKDVHPLEEADAYKRLHVPPPEGYGLTGEEIAERVGKHKATVFARMKLAELVDEDLRAAFLANTLTASAALLVARLPAEKQKEVSKIVLTGGEDHDWNPCPMTVQQLADFLEEDHGLKSKENDQVGELEDLNAKKKAAVAEVKAAEKALKEKQAKVTKTTAAVKQATTAAVAKKDPLEGQIAELTEKAEAKLYSEIVAAIDAKAKASPAVDAKLVRILTRAFMLAGPAFERMEHVYGNYGLKSVAPKSFAELSADNLRGLAARTAIEGAAGDDYSEVVMWDGNQTIHRGTWDVAETLGVDLAPIEKKAKADLAEQVKVLRERAKLIAGNVPLQSYLKTAKDVTWNERGHFHAANSVHVGIPSKSGITWVPNKQYEKDYPKKGVQTSAPKETPSKVRAPNPFKAATASAKTLAKSKAIGKPKAKK